MHTQSRSAWEEGLKRAVQIAGELRNKGWSVDDSLYYTGQAEREARELEAEGYEVQKEPVLKRRDEEIIYVIAYKPKHGTLKSQPSPKPKPKPAKAVDPIENFKSIFYKKNLQDADVDNGFLVSPDRTMAVITANADPKIKRDLMENAKKIVDALEYTHDVDYKELLDAEKKGAKYVRVNIAGEEYNYKLEKVKRAVRVLGLERSKTERPTAYVSTQHMPGVMVVTDPEGNMVLVAPVAQVPPPCKIYYWA
jgi:hypothetical protein